MIDTELAGRLDAIEKKIDAVYVSAEKTRKYIWWTGVVTFVLFVLPLVGLIFVVPSFIASYTSELQNFQ